MVAELWIIKKLLNCALYVGELYAVNYSSIKFFVCLFFKALSLCDEEVRKGLYQFPRYSSCPTPSLIHTAILKFKSRSPPITIPLVPVIFSCMCSVVNMNNKDKGNGKAIISIIFVYQTPPRLLFYYKTLCSYGNLPLPHGQYSQMGCTWPCLTCSGWSRDSGSR